MTDGRNKKASPGLGRIPSRLILTAILVFYLVLATTYSMIVPLGEAPDEVPHYHFMRYLANNKALPSGSEAGSEGFQPPLYYAIGALLTSWVSDGGFTVKANPDFSWQSAETSHHLLLHTSQEEFPYKDGALAWHIGRLLSVILGAITVVCTYFIAIELFPGNLLIALAAAGFNAFIPEFLFMSGAMNNDNMVASLSSLVLLALLRLSKRKPGIGISAIAGALIGAAILSKTNALVFLPLAMMAAGASAIHVDGWQNRLKAVVVTPTLIFVVALSICGWWFWRNQVLHGDLLGWQLKLGISDLRQASLGPQDIVWLASGLFQSFWGRFGGAAHIRMGDQVYSMLGGLSAIALLGLIIASVRAVKEQKNWLRNAVPFAIAGTLVVFTFVSLIRWTMTYLGTDQARLIYPTLSVIAILFVRGIFQFLPRKGYSLALFLAICSIFAITAPFSFILPSYLPAAQTGEAQNKNLGTIDERLELVDYSIYPETLAIGKTAYVSLRWKVISTPKSDYWLSLKIVDDAGKIIYQKETAPTNGAFTTDTWKTSSTVTTLHTIELPDYTPPGHYILKIGAHPFGSNNIIPVSIGSIQGEDGLLTLGPVDITK